MTVSDVVLAAIATGIFGVITLLIKSRVSKSQKKVDTLAKWQENLMAEVEANRKELRQEVENSRKEIKDLHAEVDDWREKFYALLAQHNDLKVKYDNLVLDMAVLRESIKKTPKSTARS